MPRREIPVIIDDYDGQELPADTEPVNLSYMGQRYKLYLSDKNSATLFDFLHQFTKDADVVFDTQKARADKADAAKATAKEDKERNAKVRQWAISSGYKYKNARGEETTLGERGRIPKEVFDAYEEVN